MLEIEGYTADKKLNMDHTSQNKIIIVANRLPFQTKEKNGKPYIQPSSGGLVSSMLSYLKHGVAPTVNHTKKAVWIGAAELSEKKFSLLEKDSCSDSTFESHPVFLPESVKSKFYQGFCNDCLWPLFHYFPSYAKFLPDHFDAYIKANELFLKTVVEVYKPGDTIWIHDYHFMLLPGMLRKVLPGASIGFFLHIPFPSFEVFRIMPGAWKSQILSGLLGADLVGFHTSDYMQYFLRSVQQVLGYDVIGRKVNTPGRIITADTFPVSIDFNKFYHASDSADVFEEKNMIRKKMNGKQLIVSVDRLDYSKAVINRLESFELFLETNREYRGRVTYMLLIVPSREIITKYKENKQEIERLISSINGKFGNIDWVPVFYQYKSVDFSKLTGLYFAADVALITPVRDGMNLVAKEFVATRIDKRGVLILSETAGAAAELKEAIIVNPTDRQEISNALLQALNMPLDEQMSRNESMQARIRNYDVVKWAEDFLGQLIMQKSLQSTMEIKELSPKMEEALLKRYSDAAQKLILLDYDGTLAPFCKRPEQAVPSPQLLELLNVMCADPANTIVLVSGRKRENIESWFKDIKINMVAEHGGYYKAHGKPWIQSKVVSTDWKEKINKILNFYQSRCAGSFIEEKTLSLAWHYRNAEKELGSMRARELNQELNELSSQLGFQVLEGNRVIEARCRDITKAIAPKLWTDSGDYDFILAIGDDRTDEDMFMALPQNAYSIRVGLTQSHATFNLKYQTEVISLLNKLCPSSIKV